MATEGHCQLLVEQDIPPSPNEGANNADWLPEYGGLSWLAYGAGNSIVITVAPVPFSKEQAALGKLFQQVIHIQRHGNSVQEGEAWVRNVVWAPVGPCLGLLAASAGRSSYVFAPQKLDSSMLCRDLSKSRMAWEQRNVVLHDFPVLGCAWTQSGDGLLVVGSEVVMWKLATENWQPLWKAHVLSPQALVAATWSIEGLAATAVGDGDVLQEKGISKPRLSTSSLENESICFENAKSIVKIWWWEESIGLQDVELSHPKPVLTLQWRPSSGRSWGVDSEYSGKYHRSVLLTFCKDGVARLWLEIDSGKARAEKAHGKERLGNRLKPAFFVSAIIDTVKDVQGNFNHNITVVWALETRIGNLMRAEEGKYDCIVPAAQISQVAPCEWVVGLRPCGSLTLWSLHCLDDIYPPRCPRVMMWQQKSGLLPSVCTSFADDIKLPSTLLSFKAIVNRPENGLAGPPTSVDLFEKFMAGHYRWSRVWPPVSAIGGDGSSDGATLVSSSTAKKNTWGISSELLHVYGHLGSVVSVAIHPVALARLAASLDDQGVVLIWSLSPFIGPPFDTGNFLVPVGRLSDRSTERLFGSEILDMLAWVPALLLGSRAILIVGSSSTVDCYSISKTGSSIKEKFGSFSVVHSHLLRLTLPFPDNTNILKGVYSVSQSFSQASGSAKISFSVIGIGHQSSVISWNLDAQVEFREQASHLNPSGNFTCHQMQSSGTPSLEDLDIHQTGSFRIKKGICSGSLQDSISCSRYVDDFANEKESIHVNLLDVTVLNDTFDTLCLEFPEAPMEFDTGKSVLGLALEVSAYDFVTCGADGFLKFWKIHFDSLPLSNSRGKSYWECVGAVQIDTQPLKMLIVALKGRMIAFVESCLGGFQRIKIFEVIYSMMKIELLLSGEILVTTPVMAIRWFDMRNSQLLLGVSSQNHVYVYAESKVSSDEFGNLFKNSIENNGKNSWVCLASVSLSFMVNKLLWAPNGSIIVASESHICALSQWMRALPGESDAFGDKVTLTAPSKNDPHYSLSIKQRLHYLLKWKRACTLLEAAAALSCPLPEYHPRSIMHFLQTGKQEQARSCLRYLGKHLISVAHSFSKTKVIGIDSVPPYFSSLTIPHMHLEDLFNIECKISTMDCSLDGRELSLNTSSRLDNQKASSSTYSKKYDFLDTKAWLDHPFIGKHQEEQSSDNKYYDGILKSGGTESLTLAEANLLVSFVQHCAEIPGILEDEKSQILAMIDVLAEIDGSERAPQFASLDQAGQRFWLATRYIARLDARKVIGTNPIETIVNSKAMAWAFQSENKETLLNMCLSTKLSWPSLRALGVGFWLTDVKVLRIIMEKLARVQYLERKDPKDCATLYLALGRQSVLSGLFKLSKDERDKPLVEFLSRNFQDERNKSAALKNAYTLMGKHRHELGVGIFLLGGDLSSACSVCVKNLNDPQLALVICRLVEGSVGPIEHNLISKHLIPSAREEGDNWLASLFRSLLQDPIGSLCELTSSKELTATYGPSESNMDLKHLIKNMSRTSRCFLLDSDIGDYCKLMASKPGMRAVLTDSGILEITSKACFTASMALKRIGLPLQALEQFHLCLKSSSKIGVDIPTDDTHYFESKNSNQTIPSFSVKGPTSWISPEVGAEIGKSLRETLALQYLAQLLLDHAGHLNSLSEDVLTNEAHMGSLAEADLQLSRDLTFLARSFSLNKEHIIFSLAILAQHYGSYHLSCRLGCRNSQSQDNFCLANELEVSGHAKTLLNLFHREAPWMVCRKILAYTQSACSGHNGNANSQVFDLLTADKNISTVSGQDFILEAQLIELVHFAKELLLLANALSRNECKHLSADERKTSGDESKRNKWSVFYLFPYVCLIAAAWLGRRPQTLLVLIKSARENPQTVANPALFSFSGKWLDLDSFFAHLSDTHLEENLEAASIDTLKMKSSFQQTKKGLSNDFLWLVMGYSLWNHLLSSVKNFLHGTTSEVSYAGYGRTPLRQSSDEIARTHPVTPSPLSLSGSLPSAKESHVSDYGDLEEILLNMLACVAIGLRKQMVSSFRGRAKTDVSLPSKLTDIIFTVDELREWREVYELLVDWEEIESSLRFEGVDLRKSTTLVQSDVGCSDSNSEPIQVQGVGKNYHRDVNNVVTGDGSAFACSSSANTQTVISNIQYGSNSKSDGARGLIESLEPKKNQSTAVRFQKPEEILHLSGELFEALCINTCSPSQVVVASNRKGLIYYDLKTRRTFSDCTDNIWSETDWPRNGWAGSISTPVPTFVSPGVGLGSKEGSCIGLGGATVGIGALPRAGKDIGKGAVGFGIPGYAGMAAWGLGWEEWDDFEGFVDPPATIANVGTKAMDSHPLRPLFLVGSNNTHIYLWEFGKSSATATYGVLPAANVPPPYALASVSAVRFDRSGHRFATAAQDGTLCTWQLEVGGRSNVCPTESSPCFNRHASDVKFVGASGGIIAATGSSQSGENLIIWDTLAPPASSRVSVVCHEGGARCLDLFDHEGSSSPLIVTGGKAGDVSVHDFRYIATGKSKRQKSSKSENSANLKENSAGGLVWFLQKAHSASITTVSSIPGTPFFLTGSKDGDVKLWDVKRCELVSHWSKVHERHMFLQHNSRGFGAVLQAAVTAIRVVPSGFITCGGDGSVQLFQHLNQGFTASGG